MIYCFHAVFSVHFVNMGDDIHAELKKLLNERIVVLDGAMGTTIREYGLDESAARGERFKAIKKDILNNGCLLYTSPSPRD